MGRGTPKAQAFNSNRTPYAEGTRWRSDGTRLPMDSKLENELARMYHSAESVYKRVLEDLRWHLDRFFEDARTRGDSDGEEAARIYFSSRISQRVKALDSVRRKCKRDKINSVDEVQTKVEDLLGFRIAAPNKEQAETLFEYLQRHEANWFCVVTAPPKFVPYTIPNRNRYSLETGYQAYHITFIHEKHYKPVTTITSWPGEIQIMSQLWEFWTNYSRRYFYGGSDATARLLPYNVVISRILDAAEDLMVATTHDIESGEVRSIGELAAVAAAATATEEAAAKALVGASIRPEAAGGTRKEEERKRLGELSPEEVGVWLKPRLADFFGSAARMPGSLFLTKIAEDLNLYGVTLDRLDEILKDQKVQGTYGEILGNSGVSYLPPYQQILCRVLIGLGWDMSHVVERVNRETWSLGIRLSAPPPGSEL